MTVARDSAGTARQTYDAYAPAYDDFNTGYMYERWTGRLLAEAEAAGLQGKRLLDVGCGTGLSFIPMLDRGWSVTACDISPAMLDLARSKAGTAATLLTADMRELPRLGEFDLIWAVNDAINYLLSPDDLEAALAGMRQNLAPTGIVVFDVNTLAAYRTFFSSECVVEANDRHFVWRGLMSPAEVEPGSLNEARFEAKGEPEAAHSHTQRHFAESEVRAALEAAGLGCLRILGESGGDLEQRLEEERHTKAVYVCAHAGYLGAGSSHPAAGESGQ
jgi:SAM-dependent methyltransferase